MATVLFSTLSLLYMSSSLYIRFSVKNDLAHIPPEAQIIDIIHLLPQTPHAFPPCIVYDLAVAQLDRRRIPVASVDIPVLRSISLPRSMRIRPPGLPQPPRDPPRRPIDLLAPRLDVLRQRRVCMRATPQIRHARPPD